MSVLSAVTCDDLHTQPYPFVYKREAIEPRLCNQLISEFPPLETVTEGKPMGSNDRFSYTVHKALEDINVSTTWKEFLQEHISQSFFRELLSLFNDEILRIYPDFESKFGKLNELRLGTRGVDSFDTADVLLDAQICVNTPVVAEPDSVRGPHVDLENKLFAGLFYLRPAADDSIGGDLHVYRVRDGKHLQYWGHRTSEELVEPVTTVPYESNSLVLFLNSINSVHGVTIRSRTSVPRMFMNLVAEVREPLFNLRDLDPTLLQKVLRKLGAGA